MAPPRKKAPILDSRRIRLRPFRTGDLEGLHALYGNADDLSYWGTDYSPSLDATRRMLRWHVAYRP